MCPENGVKVESKLTLVVDHDFDFPVLHVAHARVRGTQIDTNDGALNAVAIVHHRHLVLSVGGPGQHQAADKDKEKVEGDGPC